MNAISGWTCIFPPIYQEMIAPTLKQANNAAYEEAVKLLQKIRELMGCLDGVPEFEDYLAALRVEYKTQTQLH